MSLTRCGVVLALGLASIPAAAQAADASLVLVVGGEAYDGAPQFEVDFDGKRIGEGTVADAIDTAKDGRFADAKDRTPYVQTFTFDVPAKLFRPDGTVAIKFLNEANGGPGTNRDRNLYLASVSLNGRTVTASGLKTETDAKAVPNTTLGEFLVLADNSRVGVSAAPAGGWPAPAATVAEAPTLTSPAIVKAGAKESWTTGVKTVFPAATKTAAAPKATETAPVPKVAAAKTATAKSEPVETAMLDPDPEKESNGCAEKTYNVLGFNENSNDLTPKVEKRLAEVARDIGEAKCRLTVTGYSSTQGEYATNALFAVERAQNTLRFLKSHGVAPKASTATGAGETTQFGDTQSINRRVVIVISP